MRKMCVLALALSAGVAGAYAEIAVSKKTAPEAAPISLGNIGPLKLEKKTLRSIDRIGPVKLSSVMVKDHVKVNGPVSAKNVKVHGVKGMTINGPLKLEKSEVLGTLTVTGPLKIEHTTVTGETKLIGPMKAHKARFKKKLDITANEIEIDESHIAELVVRSTDKAAVVKVEDKSTIGKITFIGKPGIVKIDGKNTVGPIKNGTTIVK